MAERDARRTAQADEALSAAAATTQGAGVAHANRAAAARQMSFSPDFRSEDQIDHSKPASPTAIVVGSVFVKSDGDASAISPDDAKQGHMNDCVLLASMAAVARANPDAIRHMIKDNGDGTYDVTLYEPDPDPTHTRSPRVLTIDAKVPVDADGKPLYAHDDEKNAKGMELWPLLLEKAAATEWASYYALENRDPAFGLQLLTGGPVDAKFIGQYGDELLPTIATALKAHRPVIVSSLLSAANEGTHDEQTIAQAKLLHVFPDHMYSVRSVDLQANTISLQEPSGLAPLDAPLSLETFRMLFAGLVIGDVVK